MAVPTSDPWTSKTVEQALDALRGEDYDAVAVGDDDWPQALAAVVEAAAGGRGVGVTLPSEHLDALAASPAAAAVVHIEVEDVTSPYSVVFLNVRSVNFTGSLPAELPHLASCFPKLALFDAAFMEEDHVSSWAFAHPTLAALHLDDADGLTGATLGSLIGPCPNLRQLSVKECGVETAAAFCGLSARLPRLTSLDATDSPAASHKDFRKTVASAFPHLVSVNALALKTASGVSSVGDAAAHVSWGPVPTEERSSCSCLAGNPCLDPYACKDWENRHSIAAAARKDKLTLPPELRK